ncbi:dTDP-glucose 4,6-dehydratase [Paenibacillus silvae]|uniref:dTDP-glucose 4,6-dehydratase n=1 Tax=Paenibacillus silvae TaxID=1325358 RepID=UPI002002CA51|nr:dTDP-glucose 4,6-dehydratase [Paenibacillus silvae]MCK6075619.1 dTDP-glucose 4,6-dehydratase [Paenibacillus silvae]MCK6150006.1 dTDP-glucose 4,6-dehydratase [Paenibacillus silvae]MCK6268304.1 dTDP-glucose 4,6-dehydratase [Paenibacillus silvae]
MKLLVTGGAGFIGSNFVLYMLQEHPTYEIINVDALTYAGNLENLKSIESNARHTFIQADITDVQQMESIFAQGIDVVVNFAAESHVDRSILSPDVFVRTNVMGTQVLLDAAKKYQITKFVQVSTDEVYGSLGPTGLFTEETPLMPNSPYSASKAGGDLLVRAYHETFDLPVNITRCSNNYGPFQFPEKLIPLIIARALNNEAIPVYGDGLNIRDWLYVEDHCRAIDLVIHQGVSGEVYNIGGNNERTNIHIVETVLEQLGKPASLIHYVQDRLGHDRRYGIDPTKLQTELGWKPVHHFETGIKETIKWYLSHQDWMARVQSGAYQDYVKLQYGKQSGELGV